MSQRLGKADACSQLFLFGRTPSFCFLVVAYHFPVIHSHFSANPMYRSSAKLRVLQWVKPAGSTEKIKPDLFNLKPFLPWLAVGLDTTESEFSHSFIGDHT